MALRAGFAFRPSDDELIRIFLRPNIAGDPLDDVCGTFVHDVDVCSAAPATLTAEHSHASGEAESRVWFFFSPVRYRKNGRGRRLRAVGNDEGCWHSEASAKDVADATRRRVGYRQSFSYRCKNDVKPGWLMVEICADQEVGGAEAALVVCNVYRSPRAPRSAGETCEPAASVSAPSRGKRKAEDKHQDAPPSARLREGGDDELERLKRDLLLFDEPSSCAWQDEANGARAMLEFFRSDLLMGGETSVPPQCTPQAEPCDTGSGSEPMVPTSSWTEWQVIGEASSDGVLPQYTPQDMPESEQMAPKSSWTEGQMLEFIAAGGSLDDLLGEASSDGVPPQCSPQRMPVDMGAGSEQTAAPQDMPDGAGAESEQTAPPQDMPWLSPVSTIVCGGEEGFSALMRLDSFGLFPVF